MARTTAAEVQAIVEVDSTISLTPFITVANAIVTKHCVDTGFTVAELTLIETYLAAFFYRIRDKAATSEAAPGGASQSIQHVEALGFDANEYGQMAKRLDWSGALASLDNSTKNGLRRSVIFEWMGEENDESQTLSEVISN